VNTQHSLPSGRYSLLGPDFHRLDHTSLRLAHSLDDLVDEGRSFEFGNQVLISSHRKLLSSKATVVNVAEKSGHDLDRRG
jgi:hypothetical protein